MFCIDPAQGPKSMPRQPPKYLQVRESGPSGSGGGVRPDGESAVSGPADL